MKSAALGLVAIAVAVGCAAPQTQPPAYREAPPPERPSPTPRPTPKPRPVLQPYKDALSPTDLQKAEALLNQIAAFNDTYNVATKTARIALSGVVLNLQEKRRQFEATAAPEGFGQAKTWAVQAMNTEIDGLTTFMSDTTTGGIMAEFEHSLAETFWDGWTRGFNEAVESRRNAVPTAAPTRTPTPRPKRRGELKSSSTLTPWANVEAPLVRRGGLALSPCATELTE